MLEKDPASWQDETLGDKFVLFFKSFLAKIEKKGALNSVSRSLLTMKLQEMCKNAQPQENIN